MLLYNVTIGIDRNAEKIWLQWMKDRYIPVAMATGLFVDSKVFKVLHDDESEPTVSYSIQFFAHSITEVLEFLEKYDNALGQELMQNFKDRHVAFRTLLEEV
jgi:hypothetical protein